MLLQPSVIRLLFNTIFQHGNVKTAAELVEMGVRVESNAIQSCDLSYLYFTTPGVAAAVQPFQRPP